MKSFVFILSFLCTCILSFAQTQFAILSDIHVEKGSPNETYLKEVIQEINLRKPAFVIITGDLTNFGSDDELDHVHAMLGHLTSPIYVIPGNHETNWAQSAGRHYLDVWGNDRFAFSYDSLFFCGLSTGPYMRCSYGHVKAEDLKWLDATLKMNEHKNKLLFFCSHYPLQKDLDNYQKVLEILKKYHVNMAFCGHEHLFHLYNADSIPQLVNSALCSYENKIGYDWITVKRDTVFCDYCILNKENPLETIRVDLKSKNCLKDLPINPQINDSDFFLPENWVCSKVVSDTTSHMSGVVVDEKQMYYGTSSGKLICRNRFSGKLKWLYNSHYPIYSTPVIDQNLVMFGTLNNEIIAVNVNTGRKMWSIKTNGPVACDGIVKNHTLYIGGGYGEFLKVDVKTGQVIWRFQNMIPSARLQAKPTLENGKVVFGAWDTNLYCIDDLSGQLLWTWNNKNNSMFFSPGNVIPVVAENRVLIVAPDRVITILDLNSGKTISRNDKYSVRESLGYDPSRKKAYAKTMDGDLISFDFPADSLRNTKIFSLNLGYEFNPIPPVIYDTIIFNGSANGVITISSVIDGKLIGRIKCGNSLVLSLVLSKDGSLYTNMTEGLIWKISKSK